VDARVEEELFFFFHILHILSHFLLLFFFKLAAHGNYDWSIYFLFFAAVFDGLDGHVARLLHCKRAIENFLFFFYWKISDFSFSFTRTQKLPLSLALSLTPSATWSILAWPPR